MAQASEEMSLARPLASKVAYEQKLWAGIGVCPLSGVRSGVTVGGEDAVEVVAEYGVGRLGRPLVDEDAGAHGRGHGEQPDGLGACVGAGIGQAGCLGSFDEAGEIE
ncbi:MULTISPECIES: hypothetical protein [unclassified Streptomyces]|uniref:hypothetical protein n=1 Tax=unclassified Streptomyces TaxID=2593676 RepID=UPI00364E9D94